MLARTSIGTLAFLIVSALSTAHADPLTYDFTGVLSQPMNGVSQFSGSFTINGNPTASDVGALGLNQNGVLTFTPDTYTNPLLRQGIAEYGNDVSITLNIGGQTINYVNTAANPTLATFSASEITPPESRETTVTPPYDLVLLQGNTTSKNPLNSYTNGSFSMEFSNVPPTIFANLASGQVANLQSFIYTPSMGGGNAADAAGNSYNATITSIELVSTPEPSTLAIFALLGLGAVVRRNRRAS